MIRKLILVVLLIALPVSCINSTFHQYMHSLDTGARCLDGSESILYVDVGAGADAQKMPIFFKGGNNCEGDDLAGTLENCYLKSKTEHGSSKRYPKTMDLVNVSILSANKTINPVFYNWTKAYLIACDGSGHQGSKLAAVQYKGEDLYFRGANNTLASLQHLNDTYQLYLRPTIVLAGTSTGGLAAMLWANFVQENAIKSRVYVVADSAVIVSDFRSPLTNHTPVLEKAANLFKIVNTETKIPSAECVKDYPNQRECLLAGVLANYIQTPVYLIESQYDNWAIHNVLELDCVPNGEAVSLLDCDIDEERYIREYRNASLKAFQNFTSRPNAGIFAISCVQHIFSLDDSFYQPYYAIPTQTRNNVARSLEEYFQNPSASVNIRYDKVEWPFNIGCSGVI